MKIFILVLFFLGYYINGIAQPLCECNTKNEVLLYSDYKDNSVLLCGDLDTLLSASKKVVYALKIIDCKNDTVLLDFSHDEINKFIIHSFHDTIIVTSTRIILVGDSWEYDISEDEQYTITIAERVNLLGPKKIFLPPILSEKQRIELNELCALIKSAISTPKTYYPNDEKSIYMLYMGVLNNHPESIYLLNNLEKLFELDGAIAEALSEVNGQ